VCFGKCLKDAITGLEHHKTTWSSGGGGSSSSSSSSDEVEQHPSLGSEMIMMISMG